MAQDMRGRSWKSLAAARLAPFKDYLVQQSMLRDFLPSEVGYVNGVAKMQSWTQFASQRPATRSNSGSDVVTGMERVVLLPGWASRRYQVKGDPSNRAGTAYDIEIFVSGYVVKQRAPNALSRPQRTLLKLAKSFASLPKLPDPYESEDSPTNEIEALSKSTEDLLAGVVLPPRPDEITEESERRTLRYPDFVTNNSSMPAITAPPSVLPSPTSASAPSPREQLPALPLKTPSISTDSSDIQRWHSNLETRLHPFWAGVLQNRTLQISVRPHLDLTEDEAKSLSPSEQALLEQPLAVKGAVTDANGAFKIRIHIPWESLCTHPRGAPIAFVDPNREHDFFITAELMPPSPPSPQTPNEPHPLAASSLVASIPTAITKERVPLTFSPIRVISDIDDTVKLSGVGSGARSVFHNVFVKDLDENLIPGMGEWYSEMWRRGVRFHYVSNGPFELLPVIHDFFQLAQLPTGSVRLRSYGTRSLFSGLLSAPAERKRDGVLEVLTSFPDSRFILIGDSGEQDLELYASIARDHPEQILCIFIRDVNTYEDGGGGIEDPIGIRSRENARKKSSLEIPILRGGRWSPRSMSSRSLPPSPAVSRTSSESTNDYFTSPSSVTNGQRIYTDSLFSEPGSDSNFSPSITPPAPASGMSTSRAPISESDKKRMSLQMRLWKACAEVPTNIVIRVFRDPQDCVEAFQVIDPRPEGVSI
ncbi:hypothetical protein B0F90DRAFT_1695185 [Multifurca ochricompacta]|uniref:Phosphatidate phosphatase APP1 catalytic domain-containing protein n=1 Tax=Multifurca ochricompacta TaxID=376703 RepID=A0AAD4M9C5_9AGAM|nr:hypothetical protein B0F90DRAFT_1695185 [Multifurca ochricompacta]